MHPSEARRTILQQHASLRALVELLGRLVAGLVIGDAESEAALRAQVAELGRQLASHTELEEEVMGPILDELDPWGPQRRRELEATHREQRAWIARIVETASAGHGEDLAATARHLIDTLRRDIDDEERTFFGEALLRDDLIVLDQSDG